MKTLFVSVIGMGGLITLLSQCGGSTAPTEAQGDASTTDGSSSDQHHARGRAA